MDELNISVAGVASVAFHNMKVQALYDALHSEATKILDRPEAIRNALFPFVDDVINDADAYNEARGFHEFHSLITHIEKKKKLSDIYSIYTSLCLELYMYVYH